MRSRLNIKSFGFARDLAVLLVTTLLVSLPRIGVCYSFQAYGTLHTTNFTPAGKVGSFKNTKFCAAVDGEKVYIRVDYAPDYYSEWCFDGKDSYQLVDSPDRVNRAKGLRAAADIHQDS